MNLEKTKNRYSLPVAKRSVTAVVKENEAHQGPFRGAIDFQVPVDTPVLAAADGIVVKLEDKHDKFGPGRKFADKANYVVLEHKYGEYSDYVHLARGSVRVRLGDTVKRGQRLAETGLSGWMTAPHLHWFVYKIDKNLSDGFTGLEAQLRER